MVFYHPTTVHPKRGVVCVALTLTADFQEKKQHGSVLFPFNIYPCTIPRDFPSVPLHWHKSMELVYVKKGRGLVQVGMQAMETAEGGLFILPPGTLHALRGIDGYAMEYENIIFDVDFLGAGAADICAQRYLVPLAAGRLALPARLSPQDPGYAAVAASLTEAEELCREQGPGYELGVKAAMLRLLSLLLGMGAKPVPPESGSTVRLRAVLERIEQEYAQPMRVEQAAAACGLSTSHFMRWFKQMTGCSFVAYLNERRLAAAAVRLRESNDTVLTIAGDVGFENLSNFNHQFKARYGVTPREYRRGLQNRDLPFHW